MRSARTICHRFRSIPAKARYTTWIEDDDGVTVHVPVGVLARLGGAEFGWQVPALREELVSGVRAVVGEFEPAA